VSTLKKQLEEHVAGLMSEMKRQREVISKANLECVFLQEQAKLLQLLIDAEHQRIQGGGK